MSEDAPGKIGEFLYCWRCHSGLTLKEASGRMGIPLPTYARIEEGKPYEAVNLWRIMQYLFGR